MREIISRSSEDAAMMKFCIGIVIGYILGSLSMIYLIRETEADKVIARQELEAPWEVEELTEPEEVKYGEF